MIFSKFTIELVHFVKDTQNKFLEKISAIHFYQPNGEPYLCLSDDLINNFVDLLTSKKDKKKSLNFLNIHGKEITKIEFFQNSKF